MVQQLFSNGFYLLENGFILLAGNLSGEQEVIVNECFQSKIKSLILAKEMLKEGHLKRLTR